LQQATSARKIARVLFIGNSLTYANDLPRLVQSMGRHGTGLDVHCESVAFPNFSLEDHWTDGRARQKLVAGRWSVVVLQQGPSAGAEGRRVLREYTKKFAGLAKLKGARVALFTVWPARARYSDMAGVIESYTLAARDVGGTVVPVGHAWRAVLERDSSLQLYGKDGFHPSPVGTYLAALVFRRWISGQFSTGFTDAWSEARPLMLSDGAASLLERAADEAVAASGRERGSSPKFKVQSSEFKVEVQSSKVQKFKVEGSGFRVRSLKLAVRSSTWARAEARSSRRGR
jgi:hypothetical protein